MTTKTRQAIQTLRLDFKVPEDKLIELYTSKKLEHSELYRLMTTLEYVWSPTRNVWLGLRAYPSLDAARRALARAGREWERARLEFVMIGCGLLADSRGE